MKGHGDNVAGNVVWATCLLSGSLWLGAALFEYLWFNTDQASFLSVFSALDNPHSLVLRMLFTGAVIIGGFTVSRLLSRLAHSESLASAQEENLRTTLDSIGDAVIATDTDCIVTRMNPVAEKLTGWSFEEARGRALTETFQIVNARTRELSDNPVLKVLEKGRIVGLANHTLLISKDGAEYQIADSAAPIRDAEGTITGVVLVFRDVTAEYHMREATRRSEAQFRALVESSSDWIWEVDAQGVYTYASPRVESILGYRPEEILGKRPFDFMSPQEAERVAAIFIDLKSRAASIVALENLCLHRDGREVVLETGGVPVLDEAGQVIGYRGVDRDITERKRAEEALRREQEFTETALNSQQDTFFLLEPASGRAVRWNQAFSAVSGYSHEEIAELTAPDSYYSPEDLGRAGAVIAEVLKTGSGTIELELVCKDGRRIPFEYNVSAISVEDGMPQHIVAIGREITDRKRAEEERRELENQLHQSQKQEALGRLAGGVAHDFNNILTAILGNVELSMSDLRASFGEHHELLTSLEEIEEAALRATVLTRQLLTFGRRDLVQPEALNLNSTLTDLDKMLRRLITENIVLETLTDPNLKSVQADAGQMEQVIVNMVINAVDSMPGGGRLTLQTQNVLLDEAYTSSHADAQPGPHVLLAVSDTGHGMDVATQERAFEPFFTTKSVNKGTGLGLAIVYGIVKRSGGHVLIYSERGRGSTFKVYLPTVETDPAQETRGTPSDLTEHGTETILVCEDDHPVRELVARSLRTAGYSVITAENGRDGLSMAQSHPDPIDLLITDVIMPDLDGRALSERLCAMIPDLPTLFISGYTSDVIAHHGVLDRGVEFLEKPFTRKGLLEKVRAVLDKARRQDDS